MANRKNPKIPKNDFEYDEGEVYGFTNEAPVAGNCISSFSFDDDSVTDNIQSHAECKSNNYTDIPANNKTNSEINNISTNNATIQNKATAPIEIKNNSNSTKNIFDNRKTPLPNGATPAIDGETPTIKRSYTLRNSTIRKINELKSIHPDINVCVSTIVDIAIEYYHNHILNEGGTQ
ncbi:hypothetical protein CLOBY_04580 [Clostridium saccharobutylicum]|uniref:hypothetical protein n=1 Tax=Clostridium saccharobutylicum TaxID=169679 RepID=UPI000983C8F7|nr:hypothetical protein [Clostridium saccharobutylicum]AQS08367.1 hypothetical protein CLOBY_04580 [Clostridium saccharobutylicum]MBC2438297.1 hypothetical protein [Clostridium saccharobutylicum]NSB88269.1 hypothetical protein [Clostridium saccharobutylicum]NYC29300.1 hypothetical protein [Clostridium saccharobutylicum]OOM17862.1 hypothetical protein CLSAB_12760 [Clostridium saccharobutylicum]